MSRSPRISNAPRWRRALPAGASLGLSLFSEGNPLPNAVFAGRAALLGTPLVFGVQFPNFHGTIHTLCVFRSNVIVFEESGRLNEAPMERGDFAPYAILDQVAALTREGRFTWMLSWNRVIGMEIYAQPYANPVQGEPLSTFRLCS